MTTKMQSLQMPTRKTTESKAMRRVGVEIEMNGLSLNQLAQLTATYLNLDISERGRYERVLTGDQAGDWVVELDFALLKKMGRESRDEDSVAAEISSSAEEVLSWLAENLVPMELVSPPLPLDRLSEVEGIIEMLREAGAKGSSDRLWNAFGMQLNPELTDLSAATIVNYLKAFFCLYEWLFMRADVDSSRRVTSYTDPFPAEYVRKVVAADYRPDTATLIDDYLQDNPTRNRALDMLPLFLFMDEARVRKVTDDPRIKPRPTFHYRLPNCEIHMPGWGLWLAWNDWVQVEWLAADEQRLQACCEAYDEFLRSPLNRLFGDWSREVEVTWLSR